MSRPADLPNASERPWLACDRPSRWMFLLTVAAVVRGLALWQFGGQLANDPDAYRNIAENMVAGRGFGFSPGQPNGSPTAYRPPLYPGLLAIITWGCGDRDAVVRQSIGLMQLLLGAGTVALAVLTARQLRLAHASMLAGLLVALDPVLVYNTALVMTETTATFLMALLFWLGLRARGSKGWFVTGIGFGLCCLCRPAFWAFGVIVLAGWQVSDWYDRRSVDRTARRVLEWKSAGAAALGVALTVAPWVVRNAIVMGTPLLTTTHGGYTLLLGHNPFYTEQVVDQPWGAVWKIDSDERWFEWLDTRMRNENPPVDYGQPPTPGVELRRDRWMSRQAWRYMREEPLVAVRSSLTLLGRFWNVVPMLTTNRALPVSVRWTIGGFYAVTFGCALAGLIRLRREGWQRWWPCLALILSLTAVHAFYWADLRMRAPLVPALALLAALGVVGTRAEGGAAPHR